MSKQMDGRESPATPAPQAPHPETDINPASKPAASASGPTPADPMDPAASQGGMRKLAWGRQVREWWAWVVGAHDVLVATPQEVLHAMAHALLKVGWVGGLIGGVGRTGGWYSGSQNL